MGQVMLGAATNFHAKYLPKVVQGRSTDEATVGTLVPKEKNAKTAYCKLFRFTL